MAVLKSGITPKGTIFIRELNEAGQTLRKRVVKKNLQYDSKMNPDTNTCFAVIKTDWQNQGAQTLITPPKLIKNLFSTIAYKLFGCPDSVQKGANGKFYKKGVEDSMYKFSSDLKQKLRSVCGFSSDAFNRIMAELKTKKRVNDSLKRYKELKLLD